MSELSHSQPPPQPPGVGGGLGQNILTERVLIQLKDCGVNITTAFNNTSISSMDSSQQILFLGGILDEYNCTSTGPPSTGIPKNTFKSSPHVVLVIYFVTVMVLGLLVNLCVIGTILRARRLRTVTNCFVLSLAFADLLMAAVVVPLQIRELYKQQTSSAPFIDTLFPILGVASLLNLCAVTLDRYFTITNPLTYEARVSSFQAGLIITSIWIISTAQGIIHFAIRSSDQPLFQVIRFVIVFTIPFMCVFFVNTKIYCIARGHARQIRATEPGQIDSGGRSFSRKIKTAQVIGLLVGTFVLTWLPFFILTIYEQFVEQKETMKQERTQGGALEVGKMITESLACSTALFNPLLYGFLRKEVRIAIIRGIKCQNVNLSDFDTTAIPDNTTNRLEETQK